MRFRNDDSGYGVVTKALHWLTVAAITAQFAVGLTMEHDDEFDREKDRIDQLEEAGEDAAKQRGDDAEERFDAEIDRTEDELDAREDATAFADVSIADGVSLPEVHVVLGISILLLAVIRVGWRRATPLPPWAPYLSGAERALQGGLEKVMLALLFVVPVSGLVLIVGDDDWLAGHIAAQLLLLAAIAVHVGLVVKHTAFRRHRHLSRML